MKLKKRTNSRHFDSWLLRCSVTGPSKAFQYYHFIFNLGRGNISLSFAWVYRFSEYYYQHGYRNGFLAGLKKEKK